MLFLIYTDSHWGGKIVDQKNTFVYCFSFGYAIISWSTRKQGSTSQIITEVEYIAASTSCREEAWLINLVGGLFSENIEPKVIKRDI